MDLSFYAGKRVLLTGHTGFKGSWMTRILVDAGAQVLGYSRCSERDPSLFTLSDVEGQICHVRGDVRDYAHLCDAFDTFQPEIVFHLAAQPIVRESYLNPLETYETNVMGTVNVLECIRNCPAVKSAVIVTTDKVYENREWPWGYRENEPLDGFDPYSNSKSCAELAAHSYVKCFFRDRGLPVSSLRAGNVIGGGDFAIDRIIPDCIRAVRENRTIEVRNPCSTRPYQHVLEPLFAYLLVAQRQWENPSLAGSYNIGPDDCDCVTTGDLADLFCRTWGEGAAWNCRSEEKAPHEANFLKLDCSLIKSTFGWKPHWHMEECMNLICDFTRIWLSGGSIPEEMDREIALYAGTSERF